MEQFDRERALIKFRNGTCQLLVATDLAARGLDIPEIKFIIHFELPHHNKEFTHRNGRTARMNSEGAAYVLHNKGARFPEFIQEISPRKLSMEDLRHAAQPKPVQWSTLYVTGGRRDKISKGDIAGLFIKQGQINNDQLGTIELQQNCAYVGVHQVIAQELIEKTNNSKLKKKKVRISLI